MSEGNAPRRIIYNKLAFDVVGKPLACPLHKLLPYLWAVRAQSCSFLVSNCRLAGPLLSSNTENKENKKKGSQLDLSEGGRRGGRGPQVLLWLQAVFCLPTTTWTKFSCWYCGFLQIMGFVSQCGQTTMRSCTQSSLILCEGMAFGLKHSKGTSGKSRLMVKTKTSKKFWNGSDSSHPLFQVAFYWDLLLWAKLLGSVWLTEQLELVISSIKQALLWWWSFFFFFFNPCFSPWSSEKLLWRVTIFCIIVNVYS